MSEEIILHLRDVHAGNVPSDVRLRRALKCLLRLFGWKCVSITDAPSGAIGLGESDELPKESGDCSTPNTGNRRANP